MPTNVTEKRIRLGGGNVEFEGAIAATKGGEAVSNTAQEVRLIFAATSSITPTTALHDGGEYDYDQNYDDIYDDIGGIYDSCDDYNYNYDSDPTDDR